MCFFYQLSAKAQDLESRYNKNFPKEITYNKKTIIKAFEYPKMPIIIKDKKEIQVYNWGLIPHWSKDENIKKYTLNARIETISDKPAFRDSINLV
jgi:putative SOS response-associated peptidase YedK